MVRTRSCMAVVSWLLLFGTQAAVRADHHPSRYTEGKYGLGELKHIHRLPVLTVAGTPEEMGEQVAVLTATPLQRLLTYPRSLLKAYGLEASWSPLVAIGKKMVPQFPQHHWKELTALIRKAGADPDAAIAGNTFIDIKKVAGCSTLIVEADHSRTGGPLFGRNLDFPTLGFLQEYSLVTVYRPKGKHAFVSIGFPGMVGCISGMNDAGLALAVLEVYSAKDRSLRFDPRGTPYALCFRQVLEECTTVAEAEKKLRGMKRTTMLNLAICDPHGGAVFEITPKNIVVRRPKQGVCSCTNHFCTQELCTGTKCKRLPILEECRKLEKIGLKEIAAKLDAVNQDKYTLQTMIFEPAALKLHLAIGACPSSKLPLTELNLRPLFGKEK